MTGMAKRLRTSAWAKALTRSFTAITRSQLRAGTRVGRQAVKRAASTATATARAKAKAPAGAGDWIAGVSVGSAGARRHRLYRPPGVGFAERLPLLVMLHGCGQDANSFATSTRMNRIAARERFFVLYPEQDRLANPQGCWNWFDTTAGRAQGEAALIMNAIDQVCLLYPVDRARVAVAGLSAGASMAALLVTRHPDRFKAVVMHSGIPPGTAHSTLSALGAMHGRRATRPLAATGPTPRAWSGRLPPGSSAGDEPHANARTMLPSSKSDQGNPWTLKRTAPARFAQEILRDDGKVRLKRGDQAVLPVARTSVPRLLERLGIVEVDTPR